MWTLSEEEKEILELKTSLIQSRLELKQAEKWLDRCRDTINSLQDLVFEYEDRKNEKHFRFEKPKI